MPIIRHDPHGETVVQSKYWPNRVDAAGRAAWTALHSQHFGTPEWFETKWKPLIPTGCGCQQGANDLLAQCPPRYDSPEDWFAWTVQYHNLVNVKLGKPTLTLDEARAIWRP